MPNLYRMFGELGAGSFFTIGHEHNMNIKLVGGRGKGNAWDFEKEKWITVPSNTAVTQWSNKVMEPKL